MTVLRVLLVNDRLGGLETAHLKLAGDPTIDVVGRASSGPEALRKMGELKPDLTLMELTVPANGARRIFGPDVPAGRRVVAMALGDAFFRLAAGPVDGEGELEEAFGANALPLIARLFGSSSGVACDARAADDG